MCAKDRLKAIVSWFSLLLLMIGPTISYAEIDIAYNQGDESAEQRASESSSVSLTSREYSLIVAPSDAESATTPSNTKAYQIITYLFGTMDPKSGMGAIVCTPTDTQSCTTLMGDLFRVFNSGVLVFATLLLAHVIFQTTFSDASQGLAAGQKYSHNIIPLRSALGVVLITPTSTGYGYGQIIVAKILLLGSSAATGLWQQLLLYYDATGEPLGSGGITYGGNSVTDTGNSISELFVQNMATLAVCNAYLNTPQGRSAEFPSNPPAGDDVFVSEFYTSDGTVYKIRTGVSDAPPDEVYSMYQCYCGEISIGPFEEGQLSIFSNYASQIENLAYNFMQDYNFDANTVSDPTAYNTQFTILKNMLKTDLMLNGANNAALAKSSDSDEDAKSARQASEWFDVPTYFFNMLKHGDPDYDLDVHQRLSQSAAAIPTDPEREDVTDFSQEVTADSGVNFTITFPGNSGATKDFSSRMKEMFNALDKTGDALLGLSSVGRKLLQLALDLMIVSFTFSLIIATLTGIASDYSSATTFGMTTAIMTLIVAVIQAIGFLIPIASVFAIALPLVPLMTYTSAIISWIFFGVFAIMGAPIMCLGLISHGDGLGKAAPALMMLINLFFRPSLNVIGLVAGAKLFNIFYLFFTQGYLLAVNDIMDTIGVDDSALMSIMGIIFLYTYTFFVSAGAARSYSLVYQIPDKFLTWIGAQALAIPESTQGLQAAQRSVQVSAQNMQQKFQEFHKGAEKLFDQQVAEANKKYRSKEYKGPRDLKEDLKTASDYVYDKATAFGTEIYRRAGDISEATGVAWAARQVAATQGYQNAAAVGSYVTERLSRGAVQTGALAYWAYEGTSSAVGSAYSGAGSLVSAAAAGTSSVMGSIGSGIAEYVPGAGAAGSAIASSAEWVSAVAGGIRRGEITESTINTQLEAYQAAYADRRREFHTDLLQVATSADAQARVAERTSFERGLLAVSTTYSAIGTTLDKYTGSVYSSYVAPAIAAPKPVLDAAGQPVINPVTGAPEMQRGMFYSRTLDNIVSNVSNVTSLGAGLAAGSLYAVGSAAYAPLRAAAEASYDAVRSRTDPNYVAPDRLGLSGYWEQGAKERRAVADFLGVSAAATYSSAREAVATMKSKPGELTAEERIFMAASNFIPLLTNSSTALTAQFSEWLSDRNQEKMDKIAARIKKNQDVLDNAAATPEDKLRAAGSLKQDERRAQVAAIERGIHDRNMTPVVTGSRIIDFGLNTVRGTALVGGGLVTGVVGGVYGIGTATANLASNAWNREAIAAGTMEAKDVSSGFSAMKAGFAVFAVGGNVLFRTILTGNALPEGHVSLEVRAMSAAAVAAQTVMDKKSLLGATETYRSSYALATESAMAKYPVLPETANMKQRVAYAASAFSSPTAFGDSVKYRIGQAFASEDVTGTNSRTANTIVNVIGGTLVGAGGLVTGTVNALYQPLAAVGSVGAQVASNLYHGRSYKEDVVIPGWGDISSKISGGFSTAGLGMAVALSSARSFSASAGDTPSREGKLLTYIATFDAKAEAQGYRNAHVETSLQSLREANTSDLIGRSSIAMNMVGVGRQYVAQKQYEVAQFFQKDTHSDSRIGNAAINIFGGLGLTSFGLASGAVNIAYQPLAALGRTAIAGVQMASNIYQGKPYKEDLIPIGWGDLGNRIAHGFRHAGLGVATLVGTASSFREMEPGKTSAEYRFVSNVMSKIEGIPGVLSGLAERGSRARDKVLFDPPDTASNSYSSRVLNTARGAGMVLAGGVFALGLVVPATVISSLSIATTGKDLKEWTGFDPGSAALFSARMVKDGASFAAYGVAPVTTAVKDLFSGKQSAVDVMKPAAKDSEPATRSHSIEVDFSMENPLRRSPSFTPKAGLDAVLSMDESDALADHSVRPDRVEIGAGARPSDLSSGVDGYGAARDERDDL